MTRREHDPEKWTPVFGKDHALRMENVIPNNKSISGGTTMKHLGSIVLAAALACAGPALAQDKTVEWRFSHWVPPSHPMHPAAEAWAADIEKASGGTIKIK